MMFKTLVLASLLTTTAQAGVSRVGNGGVGVKCPGTEKIMLLDLVNACTPDMLYTCWGEQNEQSTRSTERWLVEYRLRLQSFLQNTHPLFQIFDKALLLGGSPKLLEQVAATQDVGMIEVPENCETVQVANSLLWTDIGVYQLGVLREFWEAATPKERALFLIHEAGHTYFTQATANPAVGSEKLRAFVGYLYIGGASVFRYKAEIEKLL